MSQPVKLSDALVLDARITGELVERSIAGQVEYWARLGRSIEHLLQGDQALALCRNAATRPLSECLESADTAKGNERLKAYLESQPFPHYEAHPNRPGLLIRIEEDGRRTTGRFVNRQFQAVKANKPVAAK
jgi:ParD-like antitoxin of type II bacterial toxin-antitoxin system